MKNSHVAVGIVLFSLLTFSCIHSENKALLVGAWNGTEWLANGVPGGTDAAQVKFRFQADGGYAANFGSYTEEGTYILREDKLYTRPKGQLEIMVRIAKLTQDSLVFEMNRGGQAETLTLIRANP
jgi:hypothetical protein